MARERVGFPGSQGARLAGRLETPDDGEPVAFALFAHCFTCSKDLKSAGGVCRELLARGIAVLRFDFTGLGESEGDFAETNFSSSVLDLVAAADFLRRERRAPALLVGHSLGGTAMLAAAPRIPEAVAVATIGAPSDTGHLRAKLAARLPSLTTPGADREAALGSAGEGDDHGLWLDLGGSRPVRIRRQLLDDLGADHLRGVVERLGRALLLFHSPVDAVVGIEHAERLFVTARHPKSFVSLGGADHLLSDPRDAAHVGAVLAAWAARYLPAAAAAGAAAGTSAGDALPALAAGEVEVTGGARRLRQEARMGAHRLVADEPVADGGADAGPTPYGLLLAALGACTGMTVRLYADRKQLPLAGTRVRLRHSRDHKVDCEGCPDGEARLELIEREVELLGPLSEEQRSRLLAIANRCPVHRTLSSGVEIVTKLS